MADQYKSRTERRRQQSKKPKKKRNGGSLAKRILLSLVIVGLVMLVGGIGTFAYFIKDAPKLNESMLKDPIPSKIYDKDGHYITSVGSENRDYVKYDEVPKLVRDAIIATEDARFYQHHGIDIIRTIKAIISNVTNGYGSQGGSTITQQVVKNSFLTHEKTIKRKVQEWWLAYQLERKYTKAQIFEMYVNKIYMSDGIFGIKAAAKHYFNKDLNQLNLTEAAMLAGMPQSPNNYNPFEHPEQAEKRKDIVLSLMKQHGKITEQQMRQAEADHVTHYLVPPSKRKVDTADNKYGAFIDLVVDEVKNMGGYNAYSDGLKIYTTLDPDAQSYVENMMNTNDVIQYPDDKFQAGLVLLDTKTGEIRAIGGGRNQKVRRGYNYAVDAHRQPGSTIKPLIDYGPAIEYLKWSTYHQLTDEPYSYSNGQPIRNANGTYKGQVSIRKALQWSYNIPALKTFQAVGPDKASEFLSNLGIHFDHMYESYAIGGMDQGPSPLQMAGAYAAFGDNGIYHKPHCIKKIVLRDGETEIKNQIDPQIAMKDYTAYMVTDMLKDVVKSGTGQTANIPGLPLAGKTGTTNYDEETRQKYGIPDYANKDSWFVGYTTKYSMAVWTGYPEPNKNYLTPEESKIAQKMFKNVMAHVSSNTETKDFKKPKSVVELPIVAGSDPPRIASKSVPRDKVDYELFVRGEEPTQYSDDSSDDNNQEKKDDKKEEEQTVSAPSGLSGQYDPLTQSITLSWNYDQPASFEVTASSSQGTTTQTTNGTSIVISGVQPGSTYSFSVVAIVDGKRSAPASTSVNVPGEENSDQSQGNNQGQGTTNPNENPTDNNNGNENSNNGMNGGNNNNDNSNGNNGNSNNQNPEQPSNNTGNGNQSGGNGSNNHTQPSQPNQPSTPPNQNKQQPVSGQSTKGSASTNSVPPNE
ncbi:MULTISPECIES: transglycosylase domain-containing protein [Bacillus]|uniref:transglycosylase domain-containing protein n=1 Tax=Bacillus TaxID=1386 RepID=UPI002E1DCE8E|nr:PBP1A family penicillin-binding protein [Bacillus smithii]MED1420099.1 PBP1A family penicillin-binding protein [Bacillus smithii]MED1455599.1 PBP1A family penicillin-binding protein [Bacillus smithii]MED1490324.1 PBP1A family penicillin-binding protein [Bacillus smithii]